MRHANKNRVMAKIIFTANKVAIDSSFEDEYQEHVQSAFEKAKEYYKKAVEVLQLETVHQLYTH